MRHIEIRVGIFVMIVLVIMAWISMRLGDYGIFEKRGYLLYATFDTAAGLDPESKVLLAGLRVGNIEGIRIREGRARVSMRIRPSIDIPKNSRAKIMSQGLLGARYVDIKPGDPSSGQMSDGDEFQIIEQPVEISRLTENIEPVIANIQAITESLRAVIDTERFRSQVDGIAGGMDETTTRIAELLAQNQENLTRVVANLENLTYALSETVARNEAEIDRTMAALPAVAEGLAAVAERLADIMEANRDDIDTTLAQLSEASTKLSGALESVDSILKKVDEGEGTVGALVNDSETIDNLNEAADGINDFLSKANRTRLDLAYDAQYLFNADYTKHYVSATLWPNPNHYFMLGIVSDEKGNVSSQEERREITTNPGEPDEEREVIVEKKDTYRDTFRFSAQIARRYWDFVIRGGLIEGEGGAGVDYYVWDDRFKFTVEAFDFEDVHMKGMFQARLFNNFLIHGGVDDFIDTDHDPYFFLGAGISISDSDIKSLISILPVSRAF